MGEKKEVEADSNENKWQIIDNEYKDPREKNIWHAKERTARQSYLLSISKAGTRQLKFVTKRKQ